MIDKSWIPSWLPGDAANIRETHNIDSNASELSFDVSGENPVVLPADCAKVNYTDSVEAYIRRSWWPDEEEIRDSFELFECKADHTQYTFVGIRKDGRRVLHWRTYSRSG